MNHLEPLKVEIRGDDGRPIAVRYVQDPRGALCESLNQYLDDGEHVIVPIEKVKTRRWVMLFCAIAAVAMIVPVSVMSMLKFQEPRRSQVAEPDPAGSVSEAPSRRQETKPEVRTIVHAPSLDAQSKILSIAYNAEDKRLLVGTEKGGVLVLDCRDGSMVRIPLGGKRIRNVAWSHKGDKFFVNAAGTVSLWNAKKMHPMFWMGGAVNFGRGMERVRFGNATGRTALIFADRLNVFDTAKRGDLCQFHLSDKNRVIRFACFNSDDSRLIAASSKRIACIDGKTGKTLWNIIRPVRAIVPSLDKKLLAICGIDSVSVFDWNGKRFSIDVCGFVDCRFHGNRLLVASKQKLMSWDLKTGRWTDDAIPLTNQPRTIGLLGESLVVVSDSSVACYNLASGKKGASCLVKEPPHPRLPSIIVDDRVIVVGEQTVSVWQP